jgi:hypothetical protein
MKSIEELKHGYEKHRQMIWILAKEMNNRFPRKLTTIAAMITGQSESTIYRHAENPDTSGVLLPVTNLILNTNITGDLTLLKYISQECGQICIPAPSKHAKYNTNITVDVCRAIKETANASEQAIKAVSDKKVTPVESEQVQRECDEAIAALMTIKAYFKNAAQGKNNE